MIQVSDGNLLTADQDMDILLRWQKLQAATMSSLKQLKKKSVIKALTI